MGNNEANFEGFAILEIMGHVRIAGYVTTQAFGGTVFFRIDTFAFPEEEETGYDGAVYTKAAIPSITKLYGASSIYCISPCTEETARAAGKAMQQRFVRRFEIKPADEIRQLEEDRSKEDDWEFNEADQI